MRGRSWLAILGFAIAAAVWARTALAVAGPAADRALYEEGRQAILEMRWRDATDTLSRLLSAHPGSDYEDDALYWRAFARAEARECAAAYSDLALLEERHPGSPRAEAGRALRVRCAGVLLVDSPADPRREEYASLISRASHSETLPARLSAAEVLLTTSPAEGARALSEVGSQLRDGTLVEIVLDRHFGEAGALARPADPTQPLGPANALVLVRRTAGADALSIPEAARAARPYGPGRYPPTTRAAISSALAVLRRSLGSAGYSAGQEVSRVLHAEDSEIHLYRGPSETVRILVLDRRRGYNPGNLRVFVEREGEASELSLGEAERMVEGEDTRAMGPRALTFVGSSLALIRLDLEPPASAGEER
jgi:hypothetical protein